MTYTCIAIKIENGVGLITLDRPDALNALSDELMHELSEAVDDLDSNPNVSALIITGSDRAFAAGADIKSMIDKTYVDAYSSDFIGSHWHCISRCRKPVIAAVNGFALGGGCELAMMCDIIIASESAKFGQPEIKLGIIPGAGGTQRLVRAIGKSKAMEMILTGRIMTADEAERAGLISRVVPNDKLISEAKQVAKNIVKLSTPSTLMAKSAVNSAFETTLDQGMKRERGIFLSLFATEDQKEGMEAFLEKRSPRWKNK